ncbi:BTB/POZ domain-containing protein 6-like [Dermacentor variabilis]|uniref:BTB/POZ domain-containing protein 6-like n=1 Tax=Dermacentor variabilis TaxID=34621 RepID=UPI003F5B7E8F
MRPDAEGSFQGQRSDPFKFLKFLDSGEFADVEFMVLPEKFPVTRTFKAHKQFLAMMNEVFGRMFFGSLPEKDRVIITDIHPDGFACMLRYFYGGKPRFRGVQDAMYTRTAAVKYMATDLERICSEYIVSHISARNVCRLIDYVSLSDGGCIDDAVLSVLRHDGVGVVCSDDFIDALDGTVEYVLNNVRNVPETCVVHRLHEWAWAKVLRSLTVEAKEGDITPPLDVKTVMKPFMPLLRFLTLTPQEFIFGPSSWHIFDGRDDFAVLCNIVCYGSVPLPQWTCSIRYRR